MQNTERSGRSHPFNGLNLNLKETPSSCVSAIKYFARCRAHH